MPERESAVILLDIKEYVQSHGQASLKDIAAGFDLTEETLGEKATNEVRKYGRENKNDKNEI